MPLTLLDFVRKWNASLLTERSSSQRHFRDRCEPGVPHPAEFDAVNATPSRSASPRTAAQAQKIVRPLFG